MRAIVSSPDGPLLQELPTPEPRADEVLVRVHAAALNRADLFMLKSAAHGSVGGAGLPLGLEWAGEIVATGANVTSWKTGDRVMASGGGAFSDYAVGHQNRIYAAPAGLSFQQAACFPVGLQTMHDAIVTNGQFRPGQSILILGASTGVGLLGLQAAKILGAGLVIGSSTNEERRPCLAEFGADLTVDTRDANWAKQITEATGGKGVDLVIDQVAGPTYNDTMRATRIGGRIVNVGRLAGNTGEIDFDLLSFRRITLVGVTFRTRKAAEVEAIVAATEAGLGPALAAGRLHMPIDSVLPLTDFKEAFTRMAANRHFGKIVLALA